MAKIKHVRTVDCVVAGYRVYKNHPDAVGSLLLGLYDDGEESVVPAELRPFVGASSLIPVGVVGAFPAARRRELFTELQPLVADFAGHPWQWAGEDAAGGGVDGRASRWNNGRDRKDQSFVPSAQNWWSRFATTTWRASDSATRHSSSGGAPTASPCHAGTASSSSRVRSISPTCSARHPRRRRVSSPPQAAAPPIHSHATAPSGKSRP